MYITANTVTHTRHIHTYIHTYIYIYIYAISISILRSLNEVIVSH